MQDIDKRIRFLETVPLFKGLDERQLNRLAKRFTERAFATGETIVSQGTLGIGLFIISKGHAEVVRALANGETVVVNQLDVTDFFGELSLLDESPRTASVHATEPTVCLVLTQLDFMGVLREDADIPIAILRVLTRRFRNLMESMQ